MASLPVIYHLVKWHDSIKPYKDPRTKDWMMLYDNPLYCLGATLLYLLFVKWLGPRIMRKRKPLELQTFMVVYNTALVFLSLYMFLEILLSAYDIGYFESWCAPYNSQTWKNPKELRMANVLWWYFISKLFEFLDTVLMVLRKKDSQVTFLHVYHHSSMLNIWWLVMSFIPGGQAWFSSCLNCLVHVIMYTYFALAAVPSLRKYLWWKKYITLFQLIQFTLNLTHTLYTTFSGCDYPLWSQYMLTSYMISMLVLFGNFYIQSYSKRPAAVEKKTDAISSNGHIDNYQKTCVHKDHVSNFSSNSNGHIEINGNHIQNGISVKHRTSNGSVVNGKQESNGTHLMHRSSKGVENPIKHEKLNNGHI